MEDNWEEKIAAIEWKKQSLQDAIEEAIRAIRDPSRGSRGMTAVKLRLAAEKYGLEIKEEDE